MITWLQDCWNYEDRFISSNNSEEWLLVGKKHNIRFSLINWMYAELIWVSDTCLDFLF